MFCRVAASCDCIQVSNIDYCPEVHLTDKVVVSGAISVRQNCFRVPAKSKSIAVINLRWKKTGTD